MRTYNDIHFQQAACFHVLTFYFPMLSREIMKLCVSVLCSPPAAQQTVAAPITTQSVFKLVEDIDALREALSCTDLQVWWPTWII